ncbi:hypothetical protein NPIL_100511, partial [Nephila pilipes]
MVGIVSSTRVLQLSHESIGPIGANLLIREQGCGRPVALLRVVRTLP